MMKKFLTSKETADYLGILESEVMDLANKGKIPAYKIGGIYTRFKLDDLESYRRKAVTRYNKKYLINLTDRLKDFFYFNDFYIISAALIVVILYFIFK